MTGAGTCLLLADGLCSLPQPATSVLLQSPPAVCSVCCALHRMPTIRPTINSAYDIDCSPTWPSRDIDSMLAVGPGEVCYQDYIRETTQRNKAVPLTPPDVPTYIRVRCKRAKRSSPLLPPCSSPARHQAGECLNSELAQRQHTFTN